MPRPSEANEPLLENPRYRKIKDLNSGMATGYHHNCAVPSQRNNITAATEHSGRHAIMPLAHYSALMDLRRS